MKSQKTLLRSILPMMVSCGMLQGAASTFGAQYQFVGDGAQNQWHEAALWEPANPADPQAVPNIEDTAVINGTHEVIVTGADAGVARLIINNSADHLIGLTLYDDVTFILNEMTLGATSGSNGVLALKNDSTLTSAFHDGPLFPSPGTYIVGGAGNGVLTLEDRATLTIERDLQAPDYAQYGLSIGAAQGGSGSVYLLGSSTGYATSVLIGSSGGVGELALAGSSTFATANLRLGRGSNLTPGSQGLVHLSAESHLTLRENPYQSEHIVGIEGGEGTILLEGGSQLTVESGALVIGYSSDAAGGTPLEHQGRGVLTLTGESTLHGDNAHLSLGTYGGVGKLELKGGARATLDRITMASHSGYLGATSEGTLEITGTGTAGTHNAELGATTLATQGGSATIHISRYGTLTTGKLDTTGDTTLEISDGGRLVITGEDHIPESDGAQSTLREGTTLSIHSGGSLKHTGKALQVQITQPHASPVEIAVTNASFEASAVEFLSHTVTNGLATLRLGQSAIARIDAFTIGKATLTTSPTAYAVHASEEAQLIVDHLTSDMGLRFETGASLTSENTLTFRHNAEFVGMETTLKGNILSLDFDSFHPERRFLLDAGAYAEVNELIAGSGEQRLGRAELNQNSYLMVRQRATFGEDQGEGHLQSNDRDSLLETPELIVAGDRARGHLEFTRGFINTTPAWAEPLPGDTADFVIGKGSTLGSQFGENAGGYFNATGTVITSHNVVIGQDSNSRGVASLSGLEQQEHWPLPDADRRTAWTIEDSLILGKGTLSRGVMEIRDLGTLSVTNDLTIGDNGYGELSLGRAVTAAIGGDLLIGRGEISQGLLTLAGAPDEPGIETDNRAKLTVGGTLSINNGALEFGAASLIESRHVTLGAQGDRLARILLTDDAQWQITGNLETSPGGTSRIEVYHSARINATGLLSIGGGVGASSTGHLHIEGPGAQIQLGGRLIMATGTQPGSATLDILGGALVSAKAGFNMASTGSVATTTLSGEGTRLVVTPLTPTGNAELLLGTGTGVATLNVLDGASLETGNADRPQQISAIIADGAALDHSATSAGTINIRGEASRWRNHGGVTLGASGAGTLNVEDGANVSIGGNLSLALYAFGQGKLVVDGGTVNVAGSTMLTQANATSSIELHNSGELSTSRMMTSASTQGESTIHITTGGELLIGGSSIPTADTAYFDRTHLTIESGGRLQTATNYNLRFAGLEAYSYLTIRGTNSHLKVGGLTTLGGVAGLAAQMEVSDKGHFETRGLTLSGAGNTLVKLTVSGTGSLLTSHFISGSTLKVDGVNQAAVLRIEDGAKALISNLVTLGTAFNNRSRIEVHGVGSEFDARGFITELGASGTASVHVEAGAIYRSRYVEIGKNATSNGSLYVSGVGSQLTTHPAGNDLGGLLIGVKGKGQAYISDRGKLIGNAYLGGHFNNSVDQGEGLMELSGQSTWDFSGASRRSYIGINAGAKGTLNVLTGSMVTGDILFLGVRSDSIGTMRVDGESSSLTLTQQLRVGEAGTGLVNLEDGATASVQSFHLGLSAGSEGTLSIHGRNTILRTTGELGSLLGTSVGEAGKGLLLIQDGGAVEIRGGVAHPYYGFRDLHIGSVGTGNGTVVVHGQDARLSVVDRIVLANATEAAGRLEIIGGGLVETSQIIKGPGLAGVIFDGGRLKITQDRSGQLPEVRELLSNFQTGQIQVKGTGAFFDTNGFSAKIDAGIVDGFSAGGEQVAGAITKEGVGKLTLTGTNTYTGETAVHEGILEIAGEGSINATSRLFVDGGEFRYNSTTPYEGGDIELSSGTLSGTNWKGKLGDVAIAQGMTISPGNSVGIASGESMIWGDGGAYRWELSDAVGQAGLQWDLLSLEKTLTYSGTNPASFTIEIVSLYHDQTPGPVWDFDPSQNYAWLIAQTGSPLSIPFEQFSIDTAGFSNPWTGRWSLGVGGDAGADLFLSYHAEAIPEPRSLFLITLAGLSWAAAARRRRRVVTPTSGAAADAKAPTRGLSAWD